MTELYVPPKDSVRNFVFSFDDNLELLFSYVEWEGAIYVTDHLTCEIGMTLSGIAKICNTTCEILEEVIILSEKKPPTKLLEIFQSQDWFLFALDGQILFTMPAMVSLLHYCAHEKLSPIAFQRYYNFSQNPDGVTLEQAMKSIINLAKVFPEKAKNLSKKRVTTERMIQTRLKKELRGKTEVKTPAGNIDLLTDEEIIEIKVGHEWKNGLGQLLAYSTYHKDKAKRLHLFGVVNNLSEIRHACSIVDVSVTIEQDMLELLRQDILENG